MIAMEGLKLVERPLKGVESMGGEDWEVHRVVSRNRRRSIKIGGDKSDDGRKGIGRWRCIFAEVVKMKAEECKGVEVIIKEREVVAWPSRLEGCAQCGVW